MSATDYFLKIDGIPGESQDAKHPNEIEVRSWSWSENNNGSMAYGGGGGVGKVSMQDFNFTMRVNRATPKLIEACAGGYHIKNCVFTCRKATGSISGGEYVIIEFTDVLISSYKIGGGQDNLDGIESCTFNYTQIQYTYKMQLSDGTLVTAGQFGWDVKKNAPATITTPQNTAPSKRA